MPSKSKAQYRKIEDLFLAGKITEKMRNDFNANVDYDSLPDYVGKKQHRRKPKKKSR